MRLKIFMITAFAGLVTLSGCKKFLEEKSQSDVIPKTAIDYRELLMGSGYMDNSEPMGFVYFLDDDVDLFWEYANGEATVIGTNPAIQYFPLFTWQPRLADRNGLGDLIAEDPGSTAYFRYYKWIMGCNAVLENIDQSIGSQQEKDRVKAEALAVRALYYFRLVNLYGEPYTQNPQALSIPLKLNSGIVAGSMPQATVAEVYNRVVADLKEASRLMDALPIVRKDYHINQPAIHILLSRVYLYMEKWDESRAEADKVFEQGGQIANLTGYTTTWLNYNNPEVEWLFGGNTQPNQTTYVPSIPFRATFDPKDVRINVGIQVQDRSLTPLVSKLPIGLDLAQTLRTPEALLNRAEANVKLNNPGPALKDLNDLRRNRIIGYTDVNITDKDQLLQAIREERRKEFCFEGFRWFDLRRYGMPEITHRYQNALGESIQEFKLAAKDPMYTLPFPNSLLIRNPELKQNASGTMPERVGH
ncbi:RagB/SusD family nutrient uptake outer membrane protein [Chitinophaga silvatica]|nr:RagB/SusD family nutrient uptake outer membrane protein [Chitinophaga silvatica]